MTTMIHGHGVLEMLVAAPEGIDRRELERRVGESFGADARYYTCSTESLTLDQLLEMLIGKGKIVVDGNRLRVVRALICAG